MNRERALKVVLVVVGLLFVAGLYPLAMFFSKEPIGSMMLSLYVTLGVFLLMAARDPAAHSSLIAFTAWSSFAHAGVMAVQEWRNILGRQELVGVGLLIVIGIALLALAPVTRSVQRTSSAAA
jgi:NADH:ubiquinone oxidoreductase subunit 5 (subunit L)/multisubunit Na+/H+ antiporter MnhA subunit